jgi:ATP-dependent exoDNAse (exonuclease V) alpha subunit
MGGRDKAEVFLLNLGNKIYFTAADRQSSEMIADSIGKHTVKKRTYGRTAGKSTMSWREEDEHWIKPHVLRDLPKHTAIIKHCERQFRRVRLKPTPHNRLVLVGDIGQHNSVEAGDALRALQTYGKVTTARLTKILRQRDPAFRNAVSLLADKKAYMAFYEFDRLGAVKQITPLPFKTSQNTMERW